MLRDLFEENDGKIERRVYILKSIYRHAPLHISKEKFKAQYENQAARLKPQTRWRRKNMKGYHLREVFVE